MSRAANLYNLQRIDIELDSHRTRLAEIEQLLGANEAVQRAGAKVEAAEAAVAEVRRALGLVKDEVEQVTNKRKNSEQRLYSGTVKNPKELQDLQDEVAALTRRLEVLEERELDALIALEEAEATEAEARGELETVASNWDSEQTDLAGEKAQREQEEARLVDEREAALIPIKAAERETYDHLRQSKGSLVVARLEDGVCAVCGMAPSASRIQQARSGTELVRCGNCGRILYVD